MTTENNSATIENLDPEPVWRFFAEISAIPRPSKKEERIRARIRALAEQHGFTSREDAAGNVVIDVPASPDCENAPITVLQGHLDMVCEKNTGTQHDFDNDPIKLIVDTDTATGEQIVRADGTTLGADNGIGVAMALAAATSPDVTHGPLELLCTVDEEAGMSGAKALPTDFIKGRRMLNLDSEQDNIIFIGCAGGCDTVVTLHSKCVPLPADAEIAQITVRGLRGGHSGADVHLNRANAIKLLTQILSTVDADDLRLVNVTGGSLRNAIPREATALVAGPAGLLDSLTSTTAQVQAVAADEHGDTDCAIRVERHATPAPCALSPDDTQRLIDTLDALPHGVLAVFPEIPGLVQTSNNLATVTTDCPTSAGECTAVIACLPRSSSAAQLESVMRQIGAVGQLAGADVKSGNGYPGWQPDFESPLLATAGRVYEKLFGDPPKITAIHAGLECGLIGERVKGMDMISIGPRVDGAHSPDERAYVASVQKSWVFLKAILADIAKE